MKVDPDRFYTPSEVADILRVKTRTLEGWRAQRRGPTWRKVEGSVRYPGRTLQAYLNGWRAVSRLESDVSKERSEPTGEDD